MLAPFRTNQSLGLLLLLAVFAFYAYLAMPLTGGFAGAFTRHTSRFLYFLSLVDERNECLRSKLYLPLCLPTWVLRKNADGKSICRPLFSVFH